MTVTPTQSSALQTLQRNIIATRGGVTETQQDINEVIARSRPSMSSVLRGAGTGIAGVQQRAAQFEQRKAAEAVGAQLADFSSQFEIQVAQQAPEFALPEVKEREYAKARTTIESNVQRLDTEIQRLAAQQQAVRTQSGLSDSPEIRSIGYAIEALAAEKSAWQGGLAAPKEETIKQFSSGYLQDVARVARQNIESQTARVSNIKSSETAPVDLASIYSKTLQTYINTGQTPEKAAEMAQNWVTGIYKTSGGNVSTIPVYQEKTGTVPITSAGKTIGSTDIYDWKIKLNLPTKDLEALKERIVPGEQKVTMTPIAATKINLTAKPNITVPTFTPYTESKLYQDVQKVTGGSGGGGGGGGGGRGDKTNLISDFLNLKVPLVKVEGSTDFFPYRLPTSREDIINSAKLGETTKDYALANLKIVGYGLSKLGEAKVPLVRTEGATSSDLFPYRLPTSKEDIMKSATLKDTARDAALIDLKLLGKLGEGAGNVLQYAGEFPLPIPRQDLKLKDLTKAVLSPITKRTTEPEYRKEQAQKFWLDTGDRALNQMKIVEKDLANLPKTPILDKQRELSDEYYAKGTSDERKEQIAYQYQKLENQNKPELLKERDVVKQRNALIGEYKSNISLLKEAKYDVKETDKGFEIKAPDTSMFRTGFREATGSEPLTKWLPRTYFEKVVPEAFTDIFQRGPEAFYKPVPKDITYSPLAISVAKGVGVGMHYASYFGKGIGDVLLFGPTIEKTLTGEIKSYAKEHPYEVGLAVAIPALTETAKGIQWLKTPKRVMIQTSTEKPVPYAEIVAKDKVGGARIFVRQPGKGYVMMSPWEQALYKKPGFADIGLTFGARGQDVGLQAALRPKGFLSYLVSPKVTPITSAESRFFVIGTTSGVPGTKWYEAARIKGNKVYASYGRQEYVPSETGKPLIGFGKKEPFGGEFVEKGTVKPLVFTKGTARARTLETFPTREYEQKLLKESVKQVLGLKKGEALEFAPDFSNLYGSTGSSMTKPLPKVELKIPKESKDLIKYFKSYNPNTREFSKPELFFKLSSSEQKTAIETTKKLNTLVKDYKKILPELYTKQYGTATAYKKFPEIEGTGVTPYKGILRYKETTQAEPSIATVFKSRVTKEGIVEITTSTIVPGKTLRPTEGQPILYTMISSRKGAGEAKQFFPEQLSKSLQSEYGLSPGTKITRINLQETPTLSAQELIDQVVTKGVPKSTTPAIVDKPRGLFYDVRAKLAGTRAEAETRTEQLLSQIRKPEERLKIIEESFKTYLNKGMGKKAALVPSLESSSSSAQEFIDTPLVAKVTETGIKPKTYIDFDKLFKEKYHTRFPSGGVGGTEPSGGIISTLIIKTPQVNIPRIISEGSQVVSGFVTGLAGATTKLLEPKYKESLVLVPQVKVESQFKPILFIDQEVKVGTREKYGSGSEDITKTDVGQILAPIETPIIETKPIEAIQPPIQQFKPGIKIDLALRPQQILRGEYPFATSIIAPPVTVGFPNIEIPAPKIKVPLFEWINEDKGPRRKQKKKVKSTGYEVFIKKKKKYIKVSPQRVSLPKEEAEALGMRAVLKGAQATYKLVPSEKPTVSIGVRIKPETRALFRPGRKAGEFVQKERLRILTPGEKKEISARGIQVRKARRSLMPSTKRKSKLKRRRGFI
jgi:hypothetical protein